MSKQRKPAVVDSIPKGWNKRVRSAIVRVVSLATMAITGARGKATKAGKRHEAETDRLKQEVHLLRQELRLKDARWLRIEPQRRPHYSPTERLAILELRAAHGWSVEQTARAFHVVAATISS